MKLLHESPVPIPLGRLVRMLGTSTSTVTRTIEPFLFREGLVEMTPRGYSTTSNVNVTTVPAEASLLSFDSACRFT